MKDIGDKQSGCQRSLRVRIQPFPHTMVMVSIGARPLLLLKSDVHSLDGKGLHKGTPPFVA